MKVRKRSIPLDMVSVEQAGRSIFITTHRNRFCLEALEGKTFHRHELIFDELFRLLAELPTKESTGGKQ